MANLPALTPTNFAEAMQFAEALAKSTMVPPAFQRNPANILVAIQWGAELGMPPLQALQNIAVINGRPAVYGDAMLALVRGSPLCEDVIEHFAGDGDSLTAICQARRKGSTPVVARFSVADAKQAGLWGKAIWQQYPTRMLQMRARGFALRDAFPDVLRGVISAEEASDTPREVKDVTPTVSAELDAFASEAGQAEIDPLLSQARAQTRNGYAAFRQWYLTEIDDDQRESLSPHIKELQQTARASEPDPVDPPDSPRGEDDGASPPAPPEDDTTIPLILPARKTRGYDWPGFAAELIEAAHKLPPDRIGDFRVKNAQQMNSLRVSLHDEWSRVQQALAEHEREGP